MFGQQREEVNACAKTSKMYNQEKTSFIGCSCCFKINPVEIVYNFDKKTEGILKV